MGSCDKQSNFSYYSKEVDLPQNSGYADNVIEVEDEYGKPIRGANIKISGTPQVRVRFNSLGPNSPYYTIHNGLPFDMEHGDLEIKRIFVSKQSLSARFAFMGTSSVNTPTLQFLQFNFLFRS